jgi:hypothetical protein
MTEKGLISLADAFDPQPPSSAPLRPLKPEVVLKKNPSVRILALWANGWTEEAAKAWEPLVGNIDAPRRFVAENVDFEIRTSGNTFSVVLAPSETVGSGPGAYNDGFLL